MACVIYKLAHGVSFLICLELFVMGKFMVFFFFHEVVYAINKTYRNFISWPKENDIQIIMVDFKTWCGLPSMQGAIDGRHVSIAKPLEPFDEDYFYHKTCGYNIVAQAVVDF